MSRSVGYCLRSFELTFGTKFPSQKSGTGLLLNLRGMDQCYAMEEVKRAIQTANCFGMRHLKLVVGQVSELCFTFKVSKA